LRRSCEWVLHKMIVRRNKRFNQEQRYIDSFCMLCYARLLARPLSNGRPLV
jgi:hypothetical protein